VGRSGRFATIGFCKSGTISIIEYLPLFLAAIKSVFLVLLPSVSDPESDLSDCIKDRIRLLSVSHTG